MTFGNILVYILLCYAIYYLAMFCYELFIKPEAVTAEKSEEEAIDITAVAAGFDPIRIDKNDSARSRSQKIFSTEPAMSGGLRADEMVAAANEIDTAGRQSLYGSIIDKWEIKPVSA